MGFKEKLTARFLTASQNVAKSRVALLSVMLLLPLVLGILGCWNGGGSENPVGPVSPVATGFDNSAAGVAQSVSFRIILPDQASNSAIPAASLLSSIRASSVASPSVTFKLVLVNVGATTNRTSTLVKTVPVSASGTAECSFTGVPALTCVSDIHIEGGSIGSYTDFQGALDLSSGTANLIELAPKNTRVVQEVSAEVINRLVASDTAFLKLLPRLSEKVRTVLNGLDFTSDAVYENAVAAYLAWHGRYLSPLSLETAGSFQPFSMVTLIGGAVPDGLTDLTGLLGSKPVSVDVLAGGRLRFLMPYLPTGKQTFEVFFNGATQTLPIEVFLPADLPAPASVTQDLLAGLETEVSVGNLASFPVTARQLIDEFKEKLAVLSESEKSEIALFLSQLPGYSQMVTPDSSIRGMAIITQQYYTSGGDLVLVRAEVEETSREITRLQAVMAKTQTAYLLDSATSEKLKSAILASVKPVQLSLYQKLRNLIAGRLREYFNEKGREAGLVRSSTIGVRGNRVSASTVPFGFESGIEYVATYSLACQNVTMDDLNLTDLGILLPQWLGQVNSLRGSLLEFLSEQALPPAIDITDIVSNEVKAFTAPIEPTRISATVTSNSKVQVRASAAGQMVSFVFITSESTPQDFTYDVAYQTPEGFRSVISEAGRVTKMPPAAPTNLKAIAGDKQVTLNWDPVTGATAYRVYWQNSAGVDTATANKVDASGPSYTLTGLINDTNYYLVVTAMDAGGAELAKSAEISAIPIASLLKMVDVPAGTFQRDADPANTSYVSAFKMSQCEITRAQFKTVMGNDPSYTVYSSGITDPVQCVNWYHAIAFCNKLSIAEGLVPAYTVAGVNFSTLAYAAIPTEADVAWNAAVCNCSTNGYRLPTEMEWMWAAIGADQDSQIGAMSGGVNVTGYAKTFAGYNGSNSLDAYAWYSMNSMGKMHPAGTKLANELGLYDMSGNVWEWCWDWYGSYPANSNSDYRGAVTGSERVVRGGRFDFSADDAVVAYRCVDYPYSQLNLIGFRVVRP
ncbi:MAG: SUMF1/EgtB/PvdO family nonheme iron enzyme [Candidatus Riflebacteria bacterium]|nr:SUMF1/EgtB/PvdO family nonheme iron enzyme [Candidatus Riflebacteria bacterium]